MNLKEINSTDQYSLPQTTECYQLQFLGAVCLFLALCGILFNSVLLYICLCRKEMRNSINSFMIALSFLNLFGCVAEMPFIVISNFSCRYIFFISIISIWWCWHGFSIQMAIWWNRLWPNFNIDVLYRLYKRLHACCHIVSKILHYKETIEYSKNYKKDYAYCDRHMLCFRTDMVFVALDWLVK